jgi:Flp pilus assembly protein TadD
MAGIVGLTALGIVSGQKSTMTQPAQLAEAAAPSPATDFSEQPKLPSLASASPPVSGQSSDPTGLSKDAVRPDYAYLAGLAALEQGDYERAIRQFSTAIEADPGDVFPYLKRAIAYEQIGERERAIADYRLALAVNRTPEMKQQVDSAIAKLSRRR